MNNSDTFYRFFSLQNCKVAIFTPLFGIFLLSASSYAVTFSTAYVEFFIPAGQKCVFDESVGFCTISGAPAKSNMLIATRAKHSTEVISLPTIEKTLAPNLLLTGPDGKQLNLSLIRKKTRVIRSYSWIEAEYLSVGPTPIVARILMAIYGDVHIASKPQTDSTTVLVAFFAKKSELTRYESSIGASIDSLGIGTWNNSDTGIKPDARSGLADMFIFPLGFWKWIDSTEVPIVLPMPSGGPSGVPPSSGR